MKGDCANERVWRTEYLSADAVYGLGVRLVVPTPNSSPSEGGGATLYPRRGRGSEGPSARCAGFFMPPAPAAGARHRRAHHHAVADIRRSSG